MGPYFCMWVDLGKNAKNRSILKPAECPTRYPRVGWYPLFLVFMCAFEALFISVNPFHAAPCSLLATYGAGVRVCLLFACGSRFEVRGSRFEVQQLRRVAGGGRIGRRLGWSLVAGRRLGWFEDRGSRIAGSRIAGSRIAGSRIAGSRIAGSRISSCGAWPADRWPAAPIQCRPGQTRVRRIGSSRGSIDGQRVQTLESIDGIGTSRFRPKRATRGSRGNGLDLVSRK